MFYCSNPNESSFPLVCLNHTTTVGMYCSASAITKTGARVKSRKLSFSRQKIFPRPRGKAMECNNSPPMFIDIMV